MLQRLSQIHRFFDSQSFYPILLSTGLALVTFALRVFLSESIYIYRNLVWNLFLAWIPYIFAVSAALLHRLAPRRWWLLIPPGLLWLAFFPNAPYIITDFLHLEQRPSVPLWFDILLLSIFAWTGIFLAIASLRTMQWLVSLYIGKIMSWLFAIVALSLTGLGIYLGRFDRWNTWDLLLYPRHIWMDVASRLTNPLDNLSFVGFTVIFTSFLAVTYLMFTTNRRLKEME